MSRFHLGLTQWKYSPAEDPVFGSILQPQWKHLNFPVSEFNTHLSYTRQPAFTCGFWNSRLDDTSLLSTGDSAKGKITQLVAKAYTWETRRPWDWEYGEGCRVLPDKAKICFPASNLFITIYPSTQARKLSLSLPQCPIFILHENFTWIYTREVKLSLFHHWLIVYLRLDFQDLTWSHPQPPLTNSIAKQAHLMTICIFIKNLFMFLICIFFCQYSLISNLYNPFSPSSRLLQTTS